MFFAYLLLFINLFIPQAQAEGDYISKLMDEPIPTGIIVFEQVQGMDKSKSNLSNYSDLKLNGYRLTGNLHFIGDRFGDLLAFDPDKCEFKYIRIYKNRQNDTIGISNNYLNTIY